MSAAHAVLRTRPNARTLVVGLALVLLAGFVIYAAQREMRKTTQEAHAPASHAFSERRPAHSAAEERFAQAMWNIHADVRTAAVRMTFAGLAYKMGDGSLADIKTKVAPLGEVFVAAAVALRALDAPESMRATRDLYAGAVQSYADAAQEMIQVAQDGKEAHLLTAQQMTERAAGVLLEVGEQLWPGEIKPN